MGKRRPLPTQSGHSTSGISKMRWVLDWPFYRVVWVSMMLGWLVAGLVDVLLLGNCDSKFGCWGGVEVGALLVVVAGVPTLIAGIAVRHLLGGRLGDKPRPLETVSALVAGVFLAWLLSTIGTWGSWGTGALEIPSLFLQWFLASAAVCAISLAPSLLVGKPMH